MAYKGKFVPTNIEKYKGNYKNIVYRSLWELKSFKWCDTNSHIIQWSSEEIIIPYRCETDYKMHRYYMDLWVKLDKPDVRGNTEMIIEVKPHNEHCPKCHNRQVCKYGLKTPLKYTPRKTKSWYKKQRTWIKNQSKWKASRKYASDRGWSFVILDEYGLGIKKLK